ncbi:hypothetical protein ASC82_06745 [Streptomyces sp. Root431]|nr:hypothetical protein ASC82_06745 [Streptomyces sp. Root431]
MKPAMPAAPSRCPMFVLTEPTRSGCPAGRPVPRAAPSAAASIGSPTGVPVPCSSTYRTSDGAVPACAWASRSTASCAAASGVVMPWTAPPLLTALPRITASTGSPSAIARESRFRTTKPPPSPRT